ncbi:MAG: VanZ family protein [Gammaproteobacteria bacterium]
MQPLRFARTWFVLSIALLVAGLVAALEPMSSKSVFEINDKVVHATAFMGFMVWFGGLFPRQRWPLVFLVLAGYGVLIEVLQGVLTVSRSADPLDVAADVSGLLLGWLLCAAGLARWPEIVESWLVRLKP